MLLRLAYLGVTNVFALLRLLPMSSLRDKDAEILALRHQLSVLQRQLGPDRVPVGPRGDRALLAALLHQIPRDVLNRLHLVVRPDTVLLAGTAMWSRAGTPRGSRPRHPGLRRLCARFASWCCGWSARILVVDEAIDGGERHGLVWEDLAPFAEWLIGGDQH